MSATVAGLLEAAVGELMKRGGSDRVETRRDAQVLLGSALGVSRAWVTAHRDDPVDPDAAAKFGLLVQRRMSGRPVAYLVGTREFYGLSLRVTPDVLIPRPETESLVEAALQQLPTDQPRKVLDLGTGSGCIAIAIAHERPVAQVTAVDRSGAALSVARENAQSLGTEVDFLESDWFAAVAGRAFDMIVSNPPYVAGADPHLQQGDLRFEPKMALEAGADGLAEIRTIVARAPEHLRAGGWLLFEHGHDQAAACRDLLANAGFAELVARADLAGISRIAGGRLLTPESPNR